MKTLPFSCSRPPPRPARRRFRAFTLAEILMGLGISSFVVGGGLWLLVAGLKTSTRTTNTTLNDLSQWGIASRLWIDSRIANGISIYADNSNANVERWLRKLVDQRGNFIVFSLSSTDGNSRTYYTKISGYYYSPSAETISRFDYDVPAADQTDNKTLEQILSNRRDAIMATYDVVARNVDLTHAGGLFICRTAGTAASLSCTVTSGGDNAAMEKEKTIEATFYVRS
jgi:hypothetical protein